MDALMVGAAARSTGWSARMLRYLEDSGLVVPGRSSAGYRQYGLRDLNRLRALRELRRRYGVELSDLAFAARLRRDRPLREAVESWLAGGEVRATDWVDWEQRKHERLLAA